MAVNYKAPTMADDNQEFSNYVALANRLADEASKETLPRFRNKTEVFNKAGLWFDPVTNADRESERAIRRMIQMVYPRHAIHGEEFGEELGKNPDGEEGNSPWRWVIDPIDGTRAFVCGVPSWMTLIALEHEEKPVLGLLDQPFTGERWVGTRDETKYYHRDDVKTCKTSTITQLDKARITTTDPRRVQGYFDASEADAFRELSKATRLARFSMDAYGYALLAHGELEIVLESGLSHHDYAALEPVVLGAGGVFTNWSGDPVGTDDRGEVLACANHELHQKALVFLH